MLRKIRYSHHSWKLLTQRIRKGSIGYFKDNMDFKVDLADYREYVYDCWINRVEPIEAKSIKNGTAYFIINYKDIQEED